MVFDASLMTLDESNSIISDMLQRHYISIVFLLTLTANQLLFQEEF